MFIQYFEEATKSFYMSERPYSSSLHRFQVNRLFFLGVILSESELDYDDKLTQKLDYHNKQINEHMNTQTFRCLHTPLSTHLPTNNVFKNYKYKMSAYTPRDWSRDPANEEKNVSSYPGQVLVVLAQEAQWPAGECGDCTVQSVDCTIGNNCLSRLHILPVSIQGNRGRYFRHVKLDKRWPSHLRDPVWLGSWLAFGRISPVKIVWSFSLRTLLVTRQCMFDMRGSYLKNRILFWHFPWEIWFKFLANILCVSCCFW